jgi:hypothetical protein
VTPTSRKDRAPRRPDRTFRAPIFELAAALALIAGISLRRAAGMGL